MGKRIIVMLFLLATVVSSLLFFFSSSTSLREKMGGVSQREPRLVAEDFTFYSYYNHQIVTTASGRRARFFEPNIIELDGNLNAYRYEDKNYAMAESVLIEYTSQGLYQILENQQLRSAELRNKVKIGTDRRELSTEFARYSHGSNKLYTDFSVEVRTPNSWMDSKKGFEYNTKTRILSLPGPVDGMFYGVRY